MCLSVCVYALCMFIQVTEEQCRLALQGEKANVRLFCTCVESLGGVPLMLPPFDSTDRPDERTIVTAVTYLAR
jgi:hypothetical protein